MSTTQHRLADFVRGFTQVVDAASGDESRILRDGRKLVADLVRQDDWLPEEFAKPDPQYYQQYLLHCDPQERFSVVSFVWGPGQKTPIHNHTVWAIIGMLRGGEKAESFVQSDEGQPMRFVGIEDLQPGDVETLSPTTGDIHKVSNLHDDMVSISVHVYGGNIGRIHRHVFDADKSTTKPFVSGYSNVVREISGVPV
ncbi:cysteine dioxygenase [Pseudorhodoferax soli]|uniref:Putative metal-dependent enzyme (Double-stranded beta helix superfamily) n=1 Tax=Pseudorhodoferax soli TaxID=545864 RepID=A0A368XLB2_9BURK|nr:cysteine dioxygenase [Pseudorhodoferax soli]RCW68645.1 putative metal-dependent enzyme (double-stranded beta helix superfamily) [Pseudorhodoferax soli]